MNSLALLMIAVLLAGLLTLRMLNRASPGADKNASSQSANTAGGRLVPKYRGPGYRAMKLRICNQPCAAAVRMRKKTLLVDEAPSLPLKGCDRTCYCEYAMFDDRRMTDERRYPSADIGNMAGASLISERRSGKDRRGRLEPYEGIY